MRLKEPERRFVLLTFLSAPPQDQETSLAAVAAARFDGLIVNDDPSLLPDVPRIIAQSRTTLCRRSAAVGKGGLMAYSANFFGVGRRLADYVDKILKGAPPDDLLIEQPTALNLAINVKTAKPLGAEIPTLLLARGDEVIE
jgi:putative ABC transport system substrate-binding protein